MFVAVDSDKTERMSTTPLKRDMYKNTLNGNWGFDGFYSDNKMMCIPRGSIKKLIGRELTWKDEPVELKE